MPRGCTRQSFDRDARVTFLGLKFHNLLFFGLLKMRVIFFRGLKNKHYFFLLTGYLHYFLGLMRKETTEEIDFHLLFCLFFETV